MLGNNDVDLVGALPEELIVELDGVRVALVHDAGRAKGRAGARLARRFPDCDVVVFGHSHMPGWQLAPLGRRIRDELSLSAAHCDNAGLSGR